jgi:hypothetical protein
MNNDKTLCSGKDCPFKETCQRFASTKTNEKKYYFTEPPYKNGDCEKYISRN